MGNINMTITKIANIVTTDAYTHGPLFLTCGLFSTHTTKQSLHARAVKRTTAPINIAVMLS